MNTELEDELENELRICCGATSDSLEVIRRTLLLMKKRSDSIHADFKNDAAHNVFTEELDNLLGYKTNVGLYYIYLHHLGDLDLIEHGCGARGSWPTKKGLEILTRLEAWAAERELKKP